MVLKVGPTYEKKSSKGEIFKFAILSYWWRFECGDELVAGDEVMVNESGQAICPVCWAKTNPGHFNYTMQFSLVDK
jgi:hypothetical protein